MNAPQKFINVEVAYANQSTQTLRLVEIAGEATVQDAIVQSGILRDFPEIDLTQMKVGIFSKACQLDSRLQTGDRVEIYRELQLDPKQRRKLLAERKKK